LSLAHTLKKEKEKGERKEIEGNKGKNKNKTNNSDPYEKPEDLLWIFLFFSQLCASFKLQELSHVWVQLPKIFS
jgi:hypothetical protein